MHRFFLTLPPPNQAHDTHPDGGLKKAICQDQK
jgi:hypothetical protein